MSFKKKLRKLRRNPEAYFRDSRVRLLRAIGTFLYSTSPPHQAGSQADNSSPYERGSRAVASDSASNTRPQRVSTERSPNRSLEDLRCLDLVFKTGCAQPDLWKFYRSQRLEMPAALATIAIYPLGVPLMDEARVAQYREDGCAAFFLPLWLYCDKYDDLDDIEFECEKNPLRANEIARSLVGDAIERKASAVVLPYDVTAVTRALVIHARAQGLITICHFPSYPPVASLYESQRPGTLPIADWALDSSSATASVADVVREDVRASPDDSAVLKTFNTSTPTRAALGIGPSDYVVALLLPPLQLSMPGGRLAEIVSCEIDRVIGSIATVDHLVIVCKRKKFGLMGSGAIASLKKKYRRSVVFYDSREDVNNTLAVSDEVVVPQGVPCRIERYSRFRCYSMASAKSEGLPAEDGIGILDRFSRVEDSVRARTSSADSLSPVGWMATHIPWRMCSTITASSHEAVIDRILNPKGIGIDVVGVPDLISSAAITEGRQKHLLNLLHANRRVYGAGTLDEANAAECFVQWGAEPSEPKERQELFRSQLRRPRIYLEDGFIRSLGLWTDPNEPTLSIVMDTRAVYYDATRPSLLEEILNSDYTLTADDRLRARHNIDKIVSHKISKYNYAPEVDLDFRAPGKRAILIVDQKAGDLSIKYGGATSASFSAMLDAALAVEDEAEIVIKQHPCAISDGDGQAHYTSRSLGPLTAKPNVHLIGFDVNPYSLIRAVDEVWVVTSGMGFEALMAGKTVRCFGLPFYSNWGLTVDEVTLDRRTKSRSLEELFFVFYVLLTRYVDPVSGESCEIEALVDYFSQHLGEAGG